MIEKLKQNKVCFGLLSKEEQECFENVGLDNCESYGEERRWWDGKGVGGFFPEYTYRIKADYQEKPKEKKIEVEIGRCGCIVANNRLLIAYLLWPNFIAFEYKDGVKSLNPRRQAFEEWSKPALIPKFVIVKE